MKNKWYVLTLSALVNSLVFGAVYSGTAVLFPEISRELGLNYAQVGFIWGSIAIGMAVFTFWGGILGDRYGSRLVIGSACLVAALSNFLRGTVSSFILLAVFMILYGTSNAVGQANLPKTVVTWFEGKSLGLVSGILGMGFCAGAAVSSMISATKLSPLLGGWRGVMNLYGAIAIIIGIIWLLTIRNKPGSLSTGANRKPLGKLFGKVIRSRDLWLDGIAFFMFFFSISGISGYMPLYFQNVKQMTVGQASNLVSIFILVSIIGSFLIPLLSDRLGRKIIYIPTVIITGLCIYLIPTLNDLPLLLAIIGCGVCGYGGGFLMHYVVVAEAQGIDATSYGAAFGLVLTIGSIGGFLGPIIGGAIAEVNPSLPFTLWAGVLVISVISFSRLKGSR